MGSSCNNRKWDKSNHTNLSPSIKKTNGVSSPAQIYSHSYVYPNPTGNYFCFQGLQRWNRERLVHKHWCYICFLLCIPPEPQMNWQQLSKPLLLQSHSQRSYSHPKLQAPLSCLIKPSHTVNALSLTWVNIHSMTVK